jgi:hypothetical protein
MHRGWFSNLSMNQHFCHVTGTSGVLTFRIVATCVVVTIMEMCTGSLCAVSPISFAFSVCVCVIFQRKNVYSLTASFLLLIRIANSVTVDALQKTWPKSVVQ